MKKLVVSFALVVLLFTSAALAQAKGRPDRLAISGPGLTGVVEVSDLNLLEGLDLMEMIAQRQIITAPNISGAYELTSYYREDNQYRVAHRVRYTLNPSGGAGFVYDLGGADSGVVANHDGKWFCAAPYADAALRSLLQRLGVAVVRASTLPPPQQLTLKGPGISGEVPLNEKVNATGLDFESMIHWTWGRMAVPIVSDGYELTRYVQNCVGQMVVDTRLRYYPGGDGRPGYVYLTESDERDPYRDVDNWFFTTPQGEANLQSLVSHWRAPLAATTSAIKLDAPLPANIVVNQPLTLGFTVTPAKSDAYLPDTLIVYAQHIDEESHRDVFTAKPSGARGHYPVALNFNRSGIWYWVINAETAAGEQPMPMLSVRDATNGASSTQANSASPIALTLVLLSVVVVAGFWMSRHSQT